jgi:hypothetical protein
MLGLIKVICTSLKHVIIIQFCKTVFGSLTGGSLTGENINGAII